jgi:hypothetical protein
MAHDVPSIEIVHMMTRVSGYEEDRLNIEGLDDLPDEAFQVVVPLRGIEARTRHVVLGVHILPKQVGPTLLAGFENASNMSEEFLRASAYAVAVVSKKRMFDAELEAGHAIDTAVAWLAIRQYYGLTSLPTGQIRNFERALARAVPSSSDLLLTRGVLSGRRWLRRRFGERPDLALSVDVLDRQHMHLEDHPGLTIADRLAMQNAARAISHSDRLTRLIAVWDAFEFYAADTAAIPLFAPAEKKACRRSLEQAGDWNKEQRARLDFGLNQMLNAPLLVRVAQAAADDGCPLSESEEAVLRRVRKPRNKASHGSDIRFPTTHDTEHALALLSRMLAFRVVARASLGRKHFDPMPSPIAAPNWLRRFTRRLRRRAPSHPTA